MTRRHELDWLRVLLFALLVPHHIAVGFVDWGVDIYRFVNDQVAGDGLTLFIYWSHSWRLPSLFMIAGIGTWFLTAGSSGPRFMLSRLQRLLVPFFFGTAFINVFGGYAIFLMTGQSAGLGAFWWNWLFDPEPRQIQHLWFLLNLTIYTLIIWPVLVLRQRIGLAVLRPPVCFTALLAASAASIVFLKPYAPALTGDNYQFVLYLIFFLGGYWIGADHGRFIEWARRYAFWLLALAAIAFLAKATLLTLALVEDIETGQALAEGGWRPLGLDPPFATVFSIVEASTAWLWCLAALGLAARFLTRPARLLAELNRAVFPFYVLHFPLTLVGLALAAQIAAPWWIEFLVLLLFVYVGTWLLWRVFDRLGPASFLVGGRPVRTRPAG